MTTREKIKKDIELLPENLLDEVEQFLATIKSRHTRPKTLPTFKLKGQFDNLDIRRQAYE